MELNAELLQFYQCKTLADLLDHAAEVFETIGFSHLVLKWSPSAGNNSKMLKNSTVVWSNFKQRFGQQAPKVSRLLQNSVSVGLKRARQNTLELQTWRLGLEKPYCVRADAPNLFFLTKYQRQIICDFGEREWSEFVAQPLSKERERVLVLEAKTQGLVSKRAFEDARTIFSVFDCVYQCLHRPVSPASPLAGIAANDQTEPVLSRREVQCLHWLAAGKTFSEAAIILDISERTLRFHVGNAKRRLGVSTTMQAVVAAAIQYGFDPKDTRHSMYFTSRLPIQTEALKVS